MRKSNLGGRPEREMKTLLELKDMDENTSSYLKRLLKNSESIKQFVKKM